jgi:small subunit ribosomal protein S27Ae
LFRSQIEESIDYAVDRLVFNTAVLSDECTISESGLTAESNVIAFMDLEGGKRKRKKKVYTKPKKIAHKHAKRPMALLQYYVVESNGKIKKLKHECVKCPVGTYMADHQDRHTCGKCGHMYYRLKADGSRMPIPKNNPPKAAAKEVVVAGKKGAAPAKKKK